MATVMYWITCSDCKHEGYDRYKGTDCEKCGSTNVSNHMEWDEQDDHHDLPSDGWGSDDEE